MRSTKFNRFHAVLAGLISLSVLCGVAVFKSVVHAEVILPKLVVPIEFTSGVVCATQEAATAIVAAMPSKTDHEVADSLIASGVCVIVPEGDYTGFVQVRGLTSSDGWQVEGISLKPDGKAGAWVIIKLPNPI